MKKYQFIQYSSSMKLPDGIYNALYNQEPTVIRIKDNIPVYVSHIGFLDVEGNSCSSAIFKPQGIIHSSVELLLPAQEM